MTCRWRVGWWYLVAGCGDTMTESQLCEVGWSEGRVEVQGKTDLGSKAKTWAVLIVRIVELAGFH